MKYYLDCEFDGFGGPLLSLALVREDGESLYFVRPDIKTVNDPWVAVNVIPILYDCPAKPLKLHVGEWGKYIAAFLSGDPKPQIIADWPDDIRYFCELLVTGPGTAVEMPNQTHFTIIRHVDIYPTDLPGAFQHNAWWDAMAIRDFVQGKAGE